MKLYDDAAKKHFVKFDNGVESLENLSQLVFWFEEFPDHIFGPQLAQVEQSTVDDVYLWEKVTKFIDITVNLKRGIDLFIVRTLIFSWVAKSLSWLMGDTSEEKVLFWVFFTHFTKFVLLQLSAPTNFRESIACRSMMA